MAVTDDELARRLRESQIDHSLLEEAAKRLARTDLDQLLLSSEMVSAVQLCSLIPKDIAKTVEGIILATSINARKRSDTLLSSLAGRILSGSEYTHDDVLTIASCVLSRDQDAN